MLHQPAPKPVDPAHLHQVLAAVASHPSAMSPLMLEYVLRGENIGRMHEKGFHKSEHFGALEGLPNWTVAEAIMEALSQELVARISGFYPALRLTPAGEAWLVSAQRQQAYLLSETAASDAHVRYIAGLPEVNA